jgi:phage gp45-like
MDRFEDFAEVDPGQEVVVQTAEGYRAGVVLALDAEMRTMTFTNGQTVVFPFEEDEQ